MAAAIRRVNSMQYDVYTQTGSVMANHRGGSGNFAEDRERHQKQVKKVDSTAGVISKMTRARI